MKSILTGIRFKYSIPLLYIFLIFILTIVIVGCGGKSPTEADNGVTISDLPGSTYSIVVMDNRNSLVLLGRLCFDTITDENISGAWLFETWGEQEDFPGLVVNGGEQFPAGIPDTPFAGQIFGDMVIIKIPLPDNDNRTLGIVIDEQDGDRLYGSADTLPDKIFSGRIDAIRVKNEQ